VAGAGVPPLPAVMELCRWLVHGFPVIADGGIRTSVIGQGPRRRCTPRDDRQACWPARDESPGLINDKGGGEKKKGRWEAEREGRKGKKGAWENRKKMKKMGKEEIKRG